jgi:uncharacterized protein
MTMLPSKALLIHREAIRKIVSDQRACNARVFGSASRSEDTLASDLDILIDTTPQTTLMDVARIQVALEKLLKVRVDVVTPAALPEKFRYDVILHSVAI